MPLNINDNNNHPPGIMKQTSICSMEPELTVAMAKIPCLDRIAAIPGLGFFMALLSGIFFATSNFTVEMTNGVDSSFIVIIRSFVQLIVFLPMSYYMKENILGAKGERWMLLQRSFFGFIAFALSYYSLSFVSLSDSSAVVFSSPVFVAVIACVILKEPCGAFQIVTVIVTICGVFMVARPEFIFGTTDDGGKFSYESRMIGIGLACITSCSMSYTYVCMRQLVKTGNIAAINYFSFFCIIFGSIMVILLKYVIQIEVIIPTTGDQWMWLFFNTLCGVGGMFCQGLALKLETAGLVSLARTFDIVMAFIFQIFILEPDHAPHTISVIGAAIVCSGCVACGLKKWVEAKPDALDTFLCRKSDSDGHGASQDVELKG